MKNVAIKASCESSMIGKGCYYHKSTKFVMTTKFYCQKYTIFVVTTHFNYHKSKIFVITANFFFLNGPDWPEIFDLRVLSDRQGCYYHKSTTIVMNKLGVI